LLVQISPDGTTWTSVLADSNQESFITGLTSSVGNNAKDLRFAADVTTRYLKLIPTYWTSNYIALRVAASYTTEPTDFPAKATSSLHTDNTKVTFKLTDDDNLSFADS